MSELNVSHGKTRRFLLRDSYLFYQVPLTPLKLHRILVKIKEGKAEISIDESRFCFLWQVQIRLADISGENVYSTSSSYLSQDKTDYALVAAAVEQDAMRLSQVISAASEAEAIAAMHEFYLAGQKAIRDFQEENS